MLDIKQVLLIGAGGAAIAGVLAGGAIREPMAPDMSPGPQLLISRPVARAPNAFDAWQPTEGAPPPPLAYLTDWTRPSREEVRAEKELAALLRDEPDAGRSMAYADSRRTDPEPFQEEDLGYRPSAVRTSVPDPVDIGSMPP